jgi:hypothetical protein
MLKLIFIATLLNVTLVNAQLPADTLYRVTDTIQDLQGYVNAKGDTVIALSKYLICFTEKFYKIAIVKMINRRLVAIDRKERILFNVFEFDNGPDYISDGLFRITKNNKIGYANINGQIIIQPRYTRAFPFIAGVAKVCINCQSFAKSNGSTTAEKEEHKLLLTSGSEWFLINKKGTRVKVK